MVKHTQIIRRLQQTNWLSVFDHFVGLAQNWLICNLRFNKFNESNKKQTIVKYLKVNGTGTRTFYVILSLLKQAMSHSQHGCYLLGGKEG